VKNLVLPGEAREEKKKGIGTPNGGGWMAEEILKSRPSRVHCFKTSVYSRHLHFHPMALVGEPTRCQAIGKKKLSTDKGEELGEGALKLVLVGKNAEHVKRGGYARAGRKGDCNSILNNKKGKKRRRGSAKGPWLGGKKHSE